MKDPLILTIDFGTQSVRAGLFNKKGETVDLVQIKYDPPYFSSKPGYAEQDPNFYYEKLCEATKTLVKNNKERISDVLGMAMSFFRDSVVICDKDNKPLRPAILWLDERRADGKFKLPALSRAIFNLVGMKETIDLNMKRSMGQWLRENEPENYEKMDKFMMISTYVNMLLLGEYVDSPSCQAGHLPIDFKKGKFYSKDNHLKGQIFGVPVNKLCRLVKQGDVVGTLCEKAAKDTGLPVGLKMLVTGSDKSAETLGLGCVDETVAAISYGTASTVEVSIDKYKDAEPFLPSYPAILNGKYNMDVQIYRGYWMLHWFEQQFGSKETLEAQLQKMSTLQVLNEKMLKIAPGSDGLILQPYWTPGLRRPLAKGAIIGWSDTHTYIHLYRSIIEGIGYALREGLEFFENKRLHHKVNEIRIAGGGSRSDAICQITADIFGLQISRVHTNECSSLGCAIAGFVCAGEFKDEKEAVKAMVRQGETFYPNKENHAKYDYLYKEVYLKMYPSLANTYKTLKNYEKKIENKEF